MQRRSFFRQTGLASLAALVSGTLFSRSDNFVSNISEHQASLQKPLRLRPGSLVALIAPGSPLTESSIQKARTTLEMLGFRVREGRFLRSKYGYLAGSDAQRLADLQEAFLDPDVEGIWCARGGYGCTRLLPRINFDIIKQNPKPFIGYSDITALHIAFYQKAGLTCFHGPIAAAELPEDARLHFQAVLMNPKKNYVIRETPIGQLGIKERKPEPFIIRTGKATGPLTGGNLSLLAAMAGTPYAPKFAGKIVFLEDVEEEPYSIDRMLTQLLQATDFGKAAGILLGVFSNCRPRGSEPSLSLEQTLRDRLSLLGMPVAYGFPCGHINYQATLPYGTRATLDTNTGKLTLLETSVQ